MTNRHMNVVNIDVEHPDPVSVRRIADVITQGGVIVYPTDTIYGIGVNAFDDEAIKRVFALKQRDLAKPLLVIVHNLDMVKLLVSTIPVVAHRLIERFWPGPLTILFPAVEHISNKLAAGTGKIGIRIPDNRLCLELVSFCGKPITSTSANVSGGANPMSVQQVADSICSNVDVIIDGGMLKSSVPSTVVDVTTGDVVIVREGVISSEEIENAL